MTHGENLLAESLRGGLGTGLTTLILGAIILWVGKTTFEHAGQLAGVEHRLNSLNGKNDTHVIVTRNGQHNGRTNKISIYARGCRQNRLARAGSANRPRRPPKQSSR